MIYAVALGAGTPHAAVERAAIALRRQTGRLVKLLPPLALPRGAVGADGSVDASALLDRLLLAAPQDTYRIAGVTTVPLQAQHAEHLIGYARRHERAVIYSTDALPRRATEAARRRAIDRIVAHELGHTFGSTHCAAECVMRDTLDPASIDLYGARLCAAHAEDLRRGLATGIDTARFLADLGAERMRLGRWREALGAYRRAARRAPRDPRLLTALGVALMGSGELVAAEEALIQASHLAPTAPQPLYARAVLYAVGWAPRRAPAFLEAAVSRDGDVLRAHRAAGILYQDVLEDELKAAYHFERHVGLGGRDPEVIARLTYLLSPTTLTFVEPEYIIARWEPGRGLLVASYDPRGHR